ncbi:DeoR/GlpR family DNA-binding transcription regulator [Motilibacter aurantiacus]|uniref:DeoR/GlpR family DNA-binding transcription regulator n=1 Tax=Motilibacter aurantiacus TaxID=2714955 RepID=UPI002F2B1C61
MSEAGSPRHGDDRRPPSEDRRGGLRRERMLSIIRDCGFVSVTDLSTMFGISTVTVRTDLDRLASRGRVRRVRGGVVAEDLSHSERPFEETQSRGALEKSAIAEAAAALVSSGETLVLDVGSTTTALARALVAREELHDVVVVTNGLTIATTLEPAIPRFTVVLSGGTLRPLQHSLVDPLADAVFDRVHADTAFLGCNGVHADAGITNVNLPEVGVKARALQSARRRICVADGSKIGHVALARICPVTDVDLLITGPSAPEDVVEALRARGVDVDVVDMPSSLLAGLPAPAAEPAGASAHAVLKARDAPDG